MTYILMAAAMALVLLFYIILWLRVREGPDNPTLTAQLSWLALRDGLAFSNVAPYGLALERLFATLVCVVFAGTMMGNEYDWRTVGVISARGVRRWHFLGAKLISSLVFTLVTVVLCLAVAMIASAWFSYIYELPFGDASLGRFLHLFASIARTWFVILPFVLLALLFATQWRSAGQAVGAALGFYFIEGIFTGILTSSKGILSAIPDFLLNINVDAIIRGNGIIGTGNSGGGPFFVASEGPPGWRAFIVLSTWLLVLGTAAFWRFQRRDIQE